MACKQCKYIDRCMSEASFLGQVFDPDYDGEHSCPEFDTFTNADRIRAMSDEELARFLADKLAKEHCNLLCAEGHIPLPTATGIMAINHTWYCVFMKWLKQPAEGE